MFLEKAYQGENNRWYMYVMTLLLVLVVMMLGSMPAAIYNTWKSDGSRFGILVEIALALFSFVVALGALAMGIKCFHGKRFMNTCTGRRRFDIKRCLHAIIVWGGIILLWMGIQYAAGAASSLRFQFDPPLFLGSFLVLLLLLPFQVAWEECVFRGYLMQGFAALFGYRWAPLLLTGLAFGFMHGSNPEVARFGFWVTMPQYILMGLILGYVAIKDDGIELSLGLHFVNNLFAMLLVTHESSALQTPALFVDANPTLSSWDTLVILVHGMLFIWLCNMKYHFMSNNNLWKKIQRAGKSPGNVLPLARETRQFSN